MMAQLKRFGWCALGCILLLGGLVRLRTSELRGGSEPGKRESKTTSDRLLTPRTGASPMLAGKIVFSKGQEREEYLEDGFIGKDVYSMNPDGSGIKCLIGNIHSFGWFRGFSPDGRTMLFSNDFNIYMFDANGTNRKRVVTESHGAWGNFISRPYFRPDGKRIIYATGALPLGGMWGYIRTINPDGSDKRQFAIRQSVSGFVRDNMHMPSYSNDSKMIVFAAGELNPDIELFPPNFEIFVVQPNGKRLTRLTENTLFDSNPSFDPAGERIVFVRGPYPIVVRSNERDLQSKVTRTQGNIWIMNADGTKQTQLTTDGGTSPIFSPDGQHIAYNRKDDIWVMNADGTNQKRIGKGNVVQWF